MRFKHILPALEIDIYDAPMEWADEDCEILHSDATIHFGVDIETREYGIKGIYTYVNKIEMSIGDNDFVFEEDEWRIDVESNLANGGIVPDRIEIDYEQKIITTHFS
tara:strand:- start:2092 stop:2412 length:321 start_codon:yes stop_codon:yes gene_type:complete